MSNWIEAYMAKSRCRLIAKEASNKSVSRFVKSNSDKQRQQPG
jgi:hypothetical protein